MLGRLRPRLLVSGFQIRSLASLAAKQHFSSPSVKNLQLNNEDGMLHVQWKDKQTSRYPLIYLRDIMQPKDYANNKTFDSLKDLQFDSEPQKVEASEDGTMVRISWHGEHVTEVDSKWLYSKRLFEKDELRGKIKLSAKGVEFWDRQSLQNKIQQFEFEDVMTKDDALYDWIYTMHSLGIAFLNNVPHHKDPMSCIRLAKRIGYVKPTHYGYAFNVHSKFDANNLAYTTAGLPLHCDIPQSQYYPGVQFLHCVEPAPTEGGGNIFVDGFHIAQELREKDPKLFDLLSTTSIPYVDIGKDVFGDFHLQMSRPVIELNELGQITRFTYNNHVREYHMNASPEATRKIYQGYLMLGKMMRDRENMMEHKLCKGRMVSFSNSRVLHGRTAYKITSAGNRHLEGCYLDWDLMYGRLRSLGSKFGKPFQG